MTATLTLPAAWGAKMRRFQFSIRDLLWLTFAAALATGWWLDHSRLTADEFGVEVNVSGWVDFDRHLIGDQ